MSDALPCTQCGGASDLASWLDRARPRLAPAESVSAACPRCDREAQLWLRSGEAAIGTLSPAPAVFRPERRIQLSELAVRARFDHVAVTLGARVWRFTR